MKLPSISVVLRPYKYQNGEQAISYRIIFNRKLIHKASGLKVLASNFCESAEAYKYVLPSDAKCNEKNALLRKEYEALEKTFYDFSMKEDLTLDTVKRLIENKATSALSFYEVAGRYINSQIENKGTLRRWKYCQELLLDFNSKLNIDQVDKRFLNNFEDFLKLKYDNANSRLAPLKFLRAVINFAIDKLELDIAYPFGKGKFVFPSEEKKLRNYLTKKQVAEIEKFMKETVDKNCQQAAAWFLFQCATGLRYSDIENWDAKNIRENRIYFSDVKTNNPHFIPINNDIAKAIKRIENLPKVSYEQYKRKLNTIGVAIKLPFTLNSHVGRHTFAVHYIEDGGNPYYLQNLLGHGDLKTTLIYAKITSKGIEDDMKRVERNKKNLS